jgi:hypothetical protein
MTIWGLVGFFLLHCEETQAQKGQVTCPQGHNWQEGPGTGLQTAWLPSLCSTWLDFLKVDIILKNRLK